MKRILNTGWISFLFLGFVFSLSFLPATTEHPDSLPLFSAFFVYTGAIVGNAFRIYGMPDTYFTDGTLMSNIKTRFYWNHGPQFTGMILASIAWPMLLAPKIA